MIPNCCNICKVEKSVLLSNKSMRLPKAGKKPLAIRAKAKQNLTAAGLNTPASRIQSECGLTWPNNLQTLSFGFWFNQSLQGLTLPDALPTLTFGQPADPDLLESKSIPCSHQICWGMTIRLRAIVIQDPLLMDLDASLPMGSGAGCWACRAVKGRGLQMWELHMLHGWKMQEPVILTR